MAFVKELKILLSTREVDKNHLWLKPRSNSNSFDLLIYNADGWEPLNIFESPCDSDIECPVCEKLKQSEN